MKLSVNDHSSNHYSKWSPLLDGKNNVAGLFHDTRSAMSAIKDLKNVGISSAEIGVAMRDSLEQQEFVEHTDTRAVEGLITRSLSDGLFGKLTGWLVGIGILSISLGISEEEARYFDSKFRGDGIFLVVNCTGQRPQITDILLAHGADIGPAVKRNVAPEDLWSFGISTA
jgi:hypothetical protein